MTGNTPLKLIFMSEINAEEVQWLWYPYILQIPAERRSHSEMNGMYIPT